jgi:hypothetical protein
MVWKQSRSDSHCTASSGLQCKKIYLYVWGVTGHAATIISNASISLQDTVWNWMELEGSPLLRNVR